jgi:hypothetical protein
MAYTRFYLVRTDSPPYTPSAWQGSWNKTGTSPSIPHTLDPIKFGYDNSIASASENVSTNPYRVGVLRSVTRKLGAQTISGTVDICAGVSETNADADMFWRVYLYVTVGDSDSVRGVLLDYEEGGGGGGTEWTTTNTARQFQAPQTLSSLAIQDGDHLVAEIGYVARNTTTTSRTGSVRFGANDAFSMVAYSDLTNGSTSTSTLAAYLDFSNAIDLSTDAHTNLRPETATTIAIPSVTTVAPQWNGAELWYKADPAGLDAIAFFAGTTAAGTYDPYPEIWKDDGDGTWSGYIGVTENNRRPFKVTITGADLLHFQIRDITNSTSTPSADLQLTLAAPPTVTDFDALDGCLFIPEDHNVEGVVPPAVVYDADGNTVYVATNTPVSEAGATLNDGTFILEGKDYILYLFERTFAAITTVAGLLDNTSTQSTPAIGTERTQFYIAQYQAALSGAGLWTVTAAGVASSLLATIPVPSGATNEINSIAPSRDNTILYYSFSKDANGIRRWDLVNDVDLTPLYAGTAGYLVHDIRVLDDGTIACAEYGNGTLTDRVLRHDTSGTLLNTYSYAAPPAFIDHIQEAVGLPQAIWVWEQPDDGTDDTLRKARVSDGTVLKSFPRAQQNGGGGAVDVPLGDPAPTFFGHANSCPLIVLRAPTTVLTPYAPSEPCCAPPCLTEAQAAVLKKTGSLSAAPLSSATGPILPAVNADWTPQCTGGGTVPTAADPTDSESWVT